MADNVNRIGINPAGVNPSAHKKPQGERPEEQPENPVQAPANPQVNPDDVFAFMANGAPVVTPRTYDISKYVTPEQARRIAGFVADFEDKVAEGLIAVESELGGLNLPEFVKLEIAAEMVE